MALSTIMPANSVSGGYEIDNSLRFNDGDTAELTRTPGSESDKQKHTFSMWVKRCTIGSNQALFSAGVDGGVVYSIRILSDSLYISQSSNFVKDTTRLFRDPSAWYHIVIAADSTQSTLNDRIKIYVNGVLETSFAANTYGGGQNLNLLVNDDVIHAVGYNTLDNATPFDGYISEFHLIDGTQKAASDFGKFDNNNEWIPKAYTGSYGTNGVYLEFKETGTGTNASGMGADTSGNDNHFAPTNLAAIDVTTDTPTNNFATMNFLDNFYSAHTMSEGNVKFVTNGTGDGPFQTATIGDLKSGKWYFEFKYTDPAHTGGGDAAGEFYGQIGICGSGLCAATNAAFSSFEHNFAYDSSNGRIKFNNTAGTVHGSQIAEDGQIIGFLVDLDNNKVSTHKNGSYADGSGNHDESFGNAAFVDVTAPESTPLGGYFIAFGENVASDASGNQNTGTYEINFGNPSFAISSSNADANGHGNFEYAVPSGYYSLCTKNLAEFG